MEILSSTLSVVRNHRRVDLRRTACTRPYNRFLGRKEGRGLPQDQEQKRTQRKGGGGSSEEGGQTAATEKAEKLKEEMDDILDEIDSVLEENAEEFVKSYVQKGGE
jgi:ubiquitin-like protein Pup